MSGPVPWPIEIYRGDDFLLQFRVREPNSGPYVDLTGWTGRAYLRALPEDGAALVAEFDVEIVDQTVERGRVRVTLEDAVTATLGVLTGEYDVELTDTADWVETYVRGPATVTPDVTYT